MADSERNWIVRILQVVVPIVGAAVAVIGLILSLSARKKELTCVYLGSEKLVSLDAGGLFPDLKVAYQNQAVRSLVKMRFVIRNTASSAIKGEDVREPLTLHFPAATQLLNASVDRTSPTEFTFQVSPKPSDGTVLCTFPLLNSGDEAYFSVYAYNSEPVAPQVTGRIVDVREVQSLDDSRSRPRNPFPFTNSIGFHHVLYWTLVILNSGCSVLFAGLCLFGMWEFYRFKRWEAKWLAPYNEAYKFTASTRPPTERFHTVLAEELNKRGIPSRPTEFYSNWKEFFQGTPVFLLLFMFFAINALFVIQSPHGF